MGLATKKHKKSLPKTPALLVFVNLCAFLWLKITPGIQQNTFVTSTFQNALS
jgi:hypothetical protein